MSELERPPLGTTPLLPPLRGAVLTGGLSRRMGRSKAQLEIAGTSFAARIASVLAFVVRDVVLLGNSTPPADTSRLPRLDDPEGLHGPLAGIIAAMRFDSRAAWLVAPCDVPLVTRDAVVWLAQQRMAGTLAILPRHPGGTIEPLIAIYEPRCRALLEPLAASSRPAPSSLANQTHIAHPEIPARLERAFTNVNRPEDLERLDG